MKQLCGSIKKGKQGNFWFISAKMSLPSINVRLPGGSVEKNLPANAGGAGATGDVGSIPGWGRSPGGGNGNPLQYSYLENPMERGAWWATAHGVTKSWTPISTRARARTHTHTHIPGNDEKRWLSLACQEISLLRSVPILSLLFVLNKLTPFWNALGLEILFLPTPGLPWQ